MNLIEAYNKADFGDKLCIGIETGFTFYIKENNLSGIKNIIDKLTASEVTADNWFIKTSKLTKEKFVPALCRKSYNPYIYCPLAFEHENDMILHYITSFENDVIRLHDQKRNSELAQRTDRCCSKITAYMNGRIHELIKRLKNNG